MTKEELKEALDKASKAHSERWHNAPLGMEWKEYEAYMMVTANEVERLSMEYRLVQTPTMTPIPDYGEFMTLKDFVRNCEEGNFIDYDGSGEYANETERSNIGIHPSDVKAGKVRTDFKFVVWYNK